MKTSVNVKFRNSTAADKEGVLYIQLIHNRKIKLITTRFRLYPHEWDNCRTSVNINTSDTERQAYLLCLQDGLNTELQTDPPARRKRRLYGRKISRRLHKPFFQRLSFSLRRIPD
jgi:hypothetical protein